MPWVRRGGPGTGVALRAASFGILFTMLLFGEAEGQAEIKFRVDFPVTVEDKDHPFVECYTEVADRECKATPGDFSCSIALPQATKAW